MNRRGRHQRAFTLTEMFVVIAITGVVVAVAVPAINGVVRSTEESFSENALLASTTVAREIAVRDGVDTAAVVLRDAGGPVRVSVVAKVGSFEDPTPDFDPFVDPPPFSLTERELFAPVPGAATQQLADGMGVRGWVRPYAMSQTGGDGAFAEPFWYDSELYGGNDRDEVAKQEGNWVAPESGYFDPESPGGAVGDGEKQTPRQSFMMRFEGGSGRLDRSSPPALVVDARPVFRSASDYSVMPDGTVVPPDWWRVEQAESVRAWARRVITVNTTNYWGSDTADDIALRRSELVGLYSNDTVICGTVGRLAMYRDRALALGIGASGVNAETGTLYAPFDPDDAEAGIRLDTDGVLDTALRRDDLGTNPQLDIRPDINRWVSGDTNLNGVITFDREDEDYEDDVFGELDQPRAEIFVIEPSTGELTGASQ